jgi:hypothetical protein
MAATIQYRGMQITVPTAELAEALRQLSLVSPIKLPDAPAQQSLLPAEENLFVPPVQREKRTDKELTLDFLSLLSSQSAAGGTPTTSVMAVLGVSHAKGVGSKTAIINRILDGAGFATPDVYVNPRDALGLRVWQAGPRIQDAMDALSQSTEGQQATPDADDDEL